MVSRWRDWFINAVFNLLLSQVSPSVAHWISCWVPQVCMCQSSSRLLSCSHSCPIIHATHMHVVCTKPHPPTARPEWLFTWLVGAFLSSVVLVWVIVSVCTNLNLDLYTRHFYSLIIHSWLQRTCTKHVLMEVCDIIVVVSHPKMWHWVKAWRAHCTQV